MLNKIFILTTILFISFATSAQDSKSDAVFQEQLKEYTLNTDGSWSYHYSHKLLINTYYAFHNLYGEDFIVYDPTFQTLKVNKSFTTMADGRQVASPSNAYNEILPGFATNIPAYNHLREMVVTHTGLERGATIDFEYTLNTSKNSTPVLSAREQLLMNSPVKKLTFKINIPAGANINYEQYNIKGKPSIERTGGRAIYTWVLTDLPAALREDFRPKENQNRPSIVFLTTPKQTDAISAFVQQEAFKLEATPDIKAFASKAVTEVNNPLIKALKLQEKTATELNTWHIPQQYAAYKVRRLDEIWKSNGATEIEKVVLLSAMLRSQNIQAEPVAVISDYFYTKKTVSVALFERYLVKVNIQGSDPIYLSPTQTDLQDQGFKFSGKRIISLVPGKTQISEVLNSASNKINVSGNFTIHPDLTIAGNMNTELGGILNPWLTLKKDTSYANAMLSNALSKAKITNMIQGKTENYLSTFNFTVLSSGYLSEKANFLFLTFPTFPSGCESWHMTELITKRNEAFEIPYTLTESYDYFFTIPDGYQLLTPNSSITMNNKFGSINIDISLEKNLLHVLRKITITDTQVSSEEYETFKTLFNSWNNKKYREVVLKKI